MHASDALHEECDRQMNSVLRSDIGGCELLRLDEANSQPVWMLAITHGKKEGVKETPKDRKEL